MSVRVATERPIGTTGNLRTCARQRADIAGAGIANPIGTILSAAMLLEYSAGESAGARKISTAVEAVLQAGFATPDLGGKHTTQQMTDEVIRQVRRI